MRLLAWATFGLLFGCTATAQEFAVDSGRTLAGTCANCHGTTGAAAAPMPSLAGVPATTIEARMREFRDGQRAATVMHQIAKGFDDAQVAAIARHFAAQPGTGR